MQNRDYVPQPRGPDTGDYLIGAYYFPGWNAYDRWEILDDFPERRPLLGYYREGDPEIADWHTYWALSHGIDFFVYDWYWNRGERRLEHALRDLNQSLEVKVLERTQELESTRDVTILTLSSLAETRDPDTGAHLNRTRRYVKTLAEQLQSNPLQIPPHRTARIS